MMIKELITKSRLLDGQRIHINANLFIKGRDNEWLHGAKDYDMYLIDSQESNMRIKIYPDFDAFYVVHDLRPDWKEKDDDELHHERDKQIDVKAHVEGIVNYTDSGELTISLEVLEILEPVLVKSTYTYHYRAMITRDEGKSTTQLVKTYRKAMVPKAKVEEYALYSTDIVSGTKMFFDSYILPWSIEYLGYENHEVFVTIDDELHNLLHLTIDPEIPGGYKQKFQVFGEFISLKHYPMTPSAEIIMNIHELIVWDDHIPYKITGENK